MSVCVTIHYVVEALKTDFVKPGVVKFNQDVKRLLISIFS